MQIDQFQGITLYAFFEAVAQQTTPLPEDLQQQMSAVAETFSTDTDCAIDQLDAIAEHPRLNPIYEATRQQLQVYKPEEMNGNLLNPRRLGKRLINQPAGILGNIKSVLRTPDVLIDDSQISSEFRQAFRPNETTN